MTTTDIARIDEKTMLERINNAAKGGKVRFLADLNPQDRQTLAQVSVRYGYDPLMGEIIIYEGRLYVTAPALERKAAESPLFEGLEDRPMSDEERKQYRYAAPQCWIAKVYKRGMRCPAVGTGTADPAKPYRNNPVERERPEWMARARAIRQAIKLYFPPASPFLGVAEDAGITVDTETGEIIEGEARIVTEAAPLASSAEPGPAGFTTDFPDDDFQADGTPEPTQAEIEAPARETGNGERAALLAEIDELRIAAKLTEAQVRTWAGKQWSREWDDLTIAHLKATKKALAEKTSEPKKGAAA